MQQVKETWGFSGASDRDGLRGRSTSKLRPAGDRELGRRVSAGEPQRYHGSVPNHRNEADITVKQVR